MGVDERFILGLSVGKVDPSATLMLGTRIVAHAEEERFIRKKKAYRAFPINAVKYCLSFVPDGLAAIESINLGFDYNQFTLDVPLYYLEEWERYGDKTREALDHEREVLQLYNPFAVQARIKDELTRAGFTGVDHPPINFFNHHYCHALSAHLSSPFEAGLSVVADGRGELDTFSVWECQGVDIKPIYKRKLPHSLGWAYRAFTIFCGFEPHSGEGKLMGLAPYGQADSELEEKVSRIIRWEEDETDGFGFSVDPEYLYCSRRNRVLPSLTERFIELFGPPASPGEPLSQYHKDVAFAAQDRLEKTLLRVVNYFVHRSGQRNLSLSGGVFLNCKASGYLWREVRDLDDIYILPMSGDDGIGLSANMAYCVREISRSRDDYSLESVFLGPSFSNDEVRAVARSFVLRESFMNAKQYAAISRSMALGITGKELSDCFKTTHRELSLRARTYLVDHLQRPDDLIPYVAKRLAEGAVIAWFQGRMEAGPRALGARSILADPRKVEARDKINSKVKYREMWRPFCPTVLREYAAEYFIKPTQSPYMINTFLTSPLADDRAPAIVHVDKTARPQILEEAANSLFYQLLLAFHGLTQVPILLNTSMNIKGEPICCDPDDAFQFFFATDVDLLAIGDFILEKC